MDAAVRETVHRDSVEFTEKLSSLIAQFGIDVERRDKSQRTALGFAAQHNRVMAVSSLLHIGANVNARSKFDATPLILAVEGEGTLEMVKVLVEQGRADPYLRTERGSTAFSAAVKGDKIEIVEYFLNHLHLPLNLTKDYTGDNGMHFAALQGNVAMLKLLINAGADVNAEGRNRLAPLAHAVSNGKAEAVRLLLRNGSDVQVLDRFSNSLLLLSVREMIIKNKNTCIHGKESHRDLKVTHDFVNGTQYDIFQLLVREGCRYTSLELSRIDSRIADSNYFPPKAYEYYKRTLVAEQALPFVNGVVDPISLQPTISLPPELVMIILTFLTGGWLELNQMLRLCQVGAVTAGEKKQEKGRAIHYAIVASK